MVQEKKVLKAFIIEDIACQLMACIKHRVPLV